ncbi:MAG: AAA family ATPase, partial [Myxococcota bacterium]
EQQRLALARAWSLEPEVLLLDEPTAALDPAATRSVERVIDDMASQGTKIIMTTHDLAQARRMGDEVLFLHHGALVERTPATRFFDEAQSSEARAFLNGELLA